MIQQELPQEASKLCQIQQFQQAFTRAYTFDRVLFYNQKIVDPYQLAANGFIKKAPNIATCQACHQQIKFDTQDLVIQLKQPYTEALQNHDSGCQFMNKHRKNYIKINKSTLSDISNQIFNRIKRTHENKQTGILIARQCWQAVTKNRSIERWYKQFDKYFLKSKQIQLSDFLCLLGWTRIEQQQLQCYFCGQKVDVSAHYTDKTRIQIDSIDNGFDGLKHHKFFCLTLTFDLFQIILKKKVSLTLKDAKGQLQTTQRQLKAKKLRQQCIQIYRQHVKKLNQLSRQLRQTVEEQQQQGKLDHLKEIGQQIKQIVFSSLKKIKLN